MNDTADSIPGAPDSGLGDVQLETVSDTALMVAACRAMETERLDGLVRDPFARRLAGERGMAIARASPIPELMCFGMGVRARFMDELLTRLLAEGGIETVVNLGAGLDTRPWRLTPHPDLRWLEADFLQILEYKAVRLKDASPHCRVEQVATDLANKEALDRLFGRIGPEPAVMITEGLLMYLPPTTVIRLAADSHRFTGIRHWLLDSISPDIMRMAPGDFKNPVEKFRPQDHLAGQALLDVVEGEGWSISAKRTYAHDGVAAAASRVASMIEKAKQSGALRESPKDEVSGMYLFKHA
jgi:O-methyltransferase involved in polyketide biosynthesis